MRGKASKQLKPFLKDRITPAYAGKSPAVSRLFSLSRDHPRLCGEKQVFRFRRHSHAGSPPPMRGKGEQRPADLHAVRDHPRLCGEKVFRRVPFLDAPGSPPPMRGKVNNSCSSGCLMKDHPRLCGEKESEVKTMGIPVGSPPPMRGKVIFLK